MKIAVEILLSQMVTFVHSTHYVNNKLFACRLLPCKLFGFWSCTERGEKFWGNRTLGDALEFIIFAVAQREESFGW
jgi:hypothetical protein